MIRTKDRIIGHVYVKSTLNGYVNRKLALSGVVNAKSMLTGCVTTKQQIVGSINTVSTLKGSIRVKAELQGSLNIGSIFKYDKFEGPYEVTPLTEQQTLNTEQKFVENTITVKAVPYAKVTNSANGTTITIGG